MSCDHKHVGVGEFETRILAENVKKKKKRLQLSLYLSFFPFHTLCDGIIVYVYGIFNYYLTNLEVILLQNAKMNGLD